jgi:hypothetical protein
VGLHQENKFGTANGNRTRILALKGLRANRCTIAAWSENDFHNYKGNAGNPPFCGNCTVVQCTLNEIAQRLTVRRKHRTF